MGRKHSKNADAPFYTDHDLFCLDALDRRLRWLSAWTVHHANHIRESRDGLKVGGHQASSASMNTIMTALYFHVLRPEDRIAVKPHASPVFHAIQYLLGLQDREQLERFRALGGAQSYPSRTKDQDDVDFSTGSVGLGVAVTAFASLVQDYLCAKGWLADEDRGRMISLVGDAELDEGNIYEALIEAAKHDIRNTWWIVDYNRQSLDAVTPERMFERYDGFFSAAGWEVVTLKYGRLLEAAFAEPGGKTLREWIDNCPNDLYAALSFEGGAAWRAQLSEDLGKRSRIWSYLQELDDDQLSRLMTNLGGHCLETLLSAFHGIEDERPRLFLCYTIKGFGLPFQGHKDNHAGLMTPTQLESLRETMNITPGEEWEHLAGLPDNVRQQVGAYLESVPFAQKADRRFVADRIDIPERAGFPCPTGEALATQAVFGRILSELSREGGTLADRIVTMSPDVTVSTNLGAWVNSRGLFARNPHEDMFRKLKIASPQRWQLGPDGQHVELGIAENNLFLLLAAFGLADRLFGTRILPVGTLYDPFIARGLDALNYACYQDARFLLVATPSGITLGPEGGAHQSVSTPLIGMGQPGLTYFEPAYADELSVIMHWAFNHMQADDGGSVYLRLSTRQIRQPDREMTPALADDICRGAYWRVPPQPGADLALVAMGAISPEVEEAHRALEEDVPGAGLLAVTSPDCLHREWRAVLTGGPGQRSHIDSLLAPLAPEAALVTVLDGSPGALSWLGSVRGQRVVPLGTEQFGQTGDLSDLYRVYGLDASAILDACARAYVDRSGL